MICDTSTTCDHWKYGTPPAFRTLTLFGKSTRSDTSIFTEREILTFPVFPAFPNCGFSISRIVEGLPFLSQPISRNCFSFLEANYLDLTKESNNSLQIETLKNLVEGNRKAKIELGFTRGPHGLFANRGGNLHMEPWSTVPRSLRHANAQGCAKLDPRFPELIKYRENPNDPWLTYSRNTCTFNIAESTQTHGLKEFLISLGVEPSIRSFTLADASIADNFPSN